MVNPDFKKLAEAYGIAAEDVETREQLDGAIERMVAHKGAYLLNVNIDPLCMVYPMVPAGARVDNILLSREEKYEPQR